MDFIEYLGLRAEKNKNTLIITTGKPGTGKSWGMLSCCLAADPDFTPEQIVFDNLSFAKLLQNPNMKKNSTILFEEVGVTLSSRDSMSKTSRLLNNLFQTFRYRNYHVFMTTPTFMGLDKGIRRLVHFHIRMIDINYQEKASYADIKYVEHSDLNDKTYRHNLMLANAANEIVNKGVLKIPTPPKEWVKIYEERKKEFQEELENFIVLELQAEINKKLRKVGVTELQKKVFDLRKAGLTQEQIAEKIGVTQPTVSDHMTALKKKGYEVV